jgi:glycerol uptake facilitator-like aquaporin
MGSGEAGAYVAAQVAGGCSGAIVANLMFDRPAIEWSAHERAAGALWFGEAVATFGLVLVILGVVRSTSATSRAAWVALAVGGYIAAAYWFTSSTSFANPAVTIARTLTDSFAGIEPASVPAFVAAQLGGGVAAVGLARFLWPALPATDIVPHEPADAA